MSNNESFIRLRPHHLLCMLTYVGRGYTPEFVENFNNVVDMLNRGAMVEIVFGPDDICKPYADKPENHPHCTPSDKAVMDNLAWEQIARALGKAWGDDQTSVYLEKFYINAEYLQELRKAFQNSEIREACGSCQWRKICDSVAQKDFAQSRLR